MTTSPPSLSPYDCVLGFCLRYWGCGSSDELLCLPWWPSYLDSCLVVGMYGCETLKIVFPLLNIVCSTITAGQTDRQTAGRTIERIPHETLDGWLHGMDGIKIIQIIIKVHWHLAGKWSAAVVLTHYHRYLSSNSKKQLTFIHHPFTIDHSFHGKVVYFYNISVNMTKVGKIYADLI